MSRGYGQRGFSLAELLVACAVFALLSSVALVYVGSDRSRQQLQQAAQQLQLAIDRGRLAAQRQHRACAIALLARGSSLERPSLPPCRGVRPLLGLQQWPGLGLDWHTNLPEQLRFSRNGLVLNGGLVVFSHPASKLRPCVVLSLPLGVTRQGEYAVDPLQELSSARCLPPS